ncbi:MAG: endopeptidase La [Gammaproteobacteria bacterium]|nr:endopeptidase La [Gammaproteobacteria bacterium]
MNKNNELHSRNDADPDHKSGATVDSLSLSYDSLPKILYIIPLFEKPFFPPQALPMLFDSKYLKQSIEKINHTPEQIGGFILSKNKFPPTSVDNLYLHGTSFKLRNPVEVNNKYQIIAEGISHFRVKKWLSKKIPYLAEVEYISDSLKKYDPIQVRAYILAIINSIKQLIPLNPLYNEELKLFLHKFINADPSYFAEFTASLTTTSKENLQNILETRDLLQKLNSVLNLIKQEMEIVKLQTQLRNEIDEKISKQQREFFLKEELKSIQEELGITQDDSVTERERYEERLSKLKIKDEDYEKINDELEKLSVLEPGSPEYAITRNYLDTITTIPFGVYSKDKVSIRNARKILNNEHEGLEDIKERILEFIAIGSLKGDIAGSIILLVGPPGVGKTSIGKSVAQALDRKFYRFSVGGMKDEAEIKGHRRTYIGAMPGKIIRALIDTQTANPVIMLDEIDKMCVSYQGDPGAALLEVLDSEQNYNFLDHYIDIRLDISKVLFICTANQLDTIPQPLLDRMEIMHLAGYITSEKMKIAKKHLWPKILEKSGLKHYQIKLSDTALKKIIEDYARGAGVRNLEQKLSKIARKAALKIITNPDVTLSITTKNLIQVLGEPVFSEEMLMYGIGVMTGLAWTAMGGATLTIEASKVHNNRRGLRITGSLGEVMRESAEIAFSFISSHLEKYCINNNFFDNALVHIHVPEGATPKDGPSAGITIASALVSLALNRAIKRSIAMTGEITLTGHVLEVGGIKEKIIAARRNKIKEVILPTSVKADVKQLPKHLLDNLKLYYVEHYDDVFKILFKKSC